MLARALGKAGRISRRARERVRSLPVRAAERKSGTPLPPGQLIFLVANTEDVSWFLDTGALAAKSIREILGKNGVAIEDCKSILDFGCGVGRVIRHWAGLEGPKISGVDYNPGMIRWCERNIAFANFKTNIIDTSLPFEDGSFDFIYCLSVFTHLSEPLQRFWMAELKRVMAPGGHLLITTHGDHYLYALTPEEQARYRAGEVVVHKANRPGSNDCAVFHPESYVRQHLARDFEVVDMIPEGAKGNPCQDLYLLKKPIA
ncbi:class I SAM-dependent methyltransferase [Singulisphaera sp. PoT]|uniref:class I SAM-dependent methyltransferase n=1 Tax=Singulisphaera sp. PoT TaxID=3411797 RepID=UPI003BF4BACC